MLKIGQNNMSNNDFHYEKMTKTPVNKLILTLSVPTVISMMGSNVYNLVDTAFVGKLGNSASGAVGVVFGFMAILQAIGFMFGQGAGSLLSRKLGAKSPKEATIIASTGFFFAFLISAALAALCWIFIDPLVVMLGSTETIAPYAKTYVRYIIFTAPFVATSFTLNNFLRYEGKAALGMIGLLSGGMINIIGDAIFMFGLDMGIAGAGLSTAISQIISFVILLSMFYREQTQCWISIKHISVENWLPVEIMATGFPSLLRQALGVLGTIVLNIEAARCAGDEAVAAMSIVSRVAFFLFAVSLGIGQGFQPVSAFNYGAGKYRRVREAYKFTVYASELVIIMLSLVALVFSGEVIRIFRDDAQVIAIGTRALRLQCAAQMVLPFTMVTEMLMQSTGEKGAASFLSSLRGGILYIPLLVILSYARGLAGVQEAQPISYILAIIPSYYFLGKFFKKMPREDD